MTNDFDAHVKDFVDSVDLQKLEMVVCGNPTMMTEDQQVVLLAMREVDGIIRRAKHEYLPNRGHSNGTAKPAIPPQHPVCTSCRDQKAFYHVNTAIGYQAKCWCCLSPEQRETIRGAALTRSL